MGKFTSNTFYLISSLIMVRVYVLECSHAGAMAGNTAGAMTGNTAGAMTGNTAEAMAGNMAEAMAGNLAEAMAGNTAGAMAGNMPGATAGNMPGATAGNMPGAKTGYMTGARPVGDCSACIQNYRSPKVFGVPAFFSNSTTPVYLPPLTFNVDLNKLSYQFCNTGYTVTLTPKGNTPFTLTGGPLCGQVYIFYTLLFSWAPSYLQTTSWTIDDRGFPLSAISYFYNAIFGSAKEAAKHRYGIVSVDVQILVTGLIPNRDFITFKKNSLKIIPYGACVDVDNAYSMSKWWLTSINTSLPYFTIPTGIYESVIGENVTVLTFAISFADAPWISICDWQIFRRFLNANNETYATNLNATFNPTNLGIRIPEATGFRNNAN